MTVRERVLTGQLIEKIDKATSYASLIGLSYVILKNQIVKEKRRKENDKKNTQ